MWLVRSYMAALAAGIDRSHIFMLRDVVDNGNGPRFLYIDDR